MCRCKVIGIDTEYGLLDRVLYYLKQNRIDPYDQAYTDRVSLCITVEHERADAVTAGLVALSAGKVIITELDDGFYPLPAVQAD
jgi:putative IMPACT (imprinted ancient) family translation regulator